MNYTIEKLIEDIEICRKLMIDAGFTSLSSTRLIPVLRENKYNAYGTCKKVPMGYDFNTGNNYRTFEIQILHIYAEVAKQKDLYETILHELCHTLPLCFNHSPNWKKAVSVINKKYGYNITTKSMLIPELKQVLENQINKTSNNQNSSATLAFEGAHYVIKCPNCGIIGKYSKCSKTIQRISYADEHNVPDFQRVVACRICHSKHLKIVQI